MDTAQSSIDRLRRVLRDVASCPRTRDNDAVQYAALPVRLVAEIHAALGATGGVEVVEQ